MLFQVTIIISGKSQHQELEAADHMTPTVRNKETWMHIELSVCFLSTLIQFRSPCLGNGVSHSGLCLLKYSKLRQPPTEMLIGQLNEDHPLLKFLYYVILACIKLANKVNHHSISVCFFACPSSLSGVCYFTVDFLKKTYLLFCVCIYAVAHHTFMWYR